jgi:hypothetical protein
VDPVGLNGAGGGALCSILGLFILVSLQAWRFSRGRFVAGEHYLLLMPINLRALLH